MYSDKIVEINRKLWEECNGYDIIQEPIINKFMHHWVFEYINHYMHNMWKEETSKESYQWWSFIFAVEYFKNICRRL